MVYARGELLQQRAVKALVVATMVLIGPLLSPVLAQDRDTVELQLGGGYVWDGGNENPAPSLPTYNVGFAVWMSDHWGFAARHVRGPGDDLWDPPYDAGDYYAAGIGNLRYTTVTTRRRWFMTGGTQLDVGFGLMLNGSYEYINLGKRPGLPPLRMGGGRTRFFGLSLELLVGRKLSQHFGIKVGSTADFNPETTSTQLVGLAVIGS